MQRHIQYLAVIAVELFKSVPVFKGTFPQCFRRGVLPLVADLEDLIFRAGVFSAVIVLYLDPARLMTGFDAAAVSFSYIIPEFFLIIFELSV